MAKAKECIVKITSKGQVTFPKVMRDRIHAETGDYILFRAKGDKVEVEKIAMTPEEQLIQLSRATQARFKKSGVTRKDVEEAIRWARKSS